MPIPPITLPSSSPSFLPSPPELTSLFSSYRGDLTQWLTAHFKKDDEEECYTTPIFYKNVPLTLIFIKGEEGENTLSIKWQSPEMDYILVAFYINDTENKADFTIPPTPHSPLSGNDRLEIALTFRSHFRFSLEFSDVAEARCISLCDKKRQTPLSLRALHILRDQKGWYEAHGAVPQGGALFWSHGDKFTAIEISPLRYRLTAERIVSISLLSVEKIMAGRKEAQQLQDLKKFLHAKHLFPDSTPTLQAVARLFAIQRLNFKKNTAWHKAFHDFYEGCMLPSLSVIEGEEYPDYAKLLSYEEAKSLLEEIDCLDFEALLQTDLSRAKNLYWLYWMIIKHSEEFAFPPPEPSSPHPKRHCPLSIP